MRTRRTRLLGFAAFVAVAALLVAACGPPAAPPPPSPAAQDMVERHNYVRSLNGIGSLSVDGYMQGNAQMHAERVAAGAGACAHLWHSGELGAWYGGHASAENVACVAGCPNDAGRAFDMWVGSPAHSGNVFNGGYRWIGVGVACNHANGVAIFVAHYRSP